MFETQKVRRHDKFMVSTLEQMQVPNGNVSRISKVVTLVKLGFIPTNQIRPLWQQKIENDACFITI